MSGVAVTHLDDADAPLMTGSHDGADGATVLQHRGADFKSCGVDPDVGQLVLNDTDGSSGVVTAVTEDTVTCTLTGGTDNDWDNGDTYIILKTETEDSHISTIWTDRRFGQKTTNPAELNEDGVFPEDADLDEVDEEVWGPGQPERNYRG
jgi:hypothetical protein